MLDVSPDVISALARRLSAVAQVLSTRDHITFEAEIGSIAEGIKKLASTVRDAADDASAWLLLVGISGAIPSPEDVMELRSQLRLGAGERDLIGVLESALGPASNSRTLHMDIEIAVGEVLVDVDFAAKNGLNTGVQRVVRQTFSRWENKYPHRLVVWTRDGQMLRNLVGKEPDRVRRWESSMRYEQEPKGNPSGMTLVVPWKSVLIVPEVSQPDSIEGLRSIALASGSAVVIIGHDAIPVLSPEYVLPEESERFALFLGALKYSTKVLTVSKSAAAEFTGFVETLPSQGLVGPRVETIMLATEKVVPEKSHAPELKRRNPSVPLVLCVGTQEPRKNQTTLLAAAEILWASGSEFELIFIGAGAPPLSSSFDKAVIELQKRSRPVTVLRHASDREVAEAYDAALFTVLPSLHEGFGLPVAESLAHGKPAIVSNFGSVAEIATEGGCLLVDPRSPEDVAAKMKDLLTSPATIKNLTEQASHREPRTWEAYSDEIWTAAQSELAL